jgi:hypothetical protein
MQATPCGGNTTPRRRLPAFVVEFNKAIVLLLGHEKHKGNSDDPELVVLNKTSRLYAELPKKSLVMHQSDCWETSA